jgi:SAM-dependent MidA family methyltransferase
MQPSEYPVPSPEVLGALLRRAGPGAVLGFDAFMEVALYEPGIGYYRRVRPRVGQGSGTDFVTASSSKPVFGRLVAAAASALLSPRDPAAHAFVEIGSEGGASVLDGVDHPFRTVRTVGVGEALAISGPSVVFSNELFDAQPFRRFRFRGGAWREIGVAVSGSGLSETELPCPGAPAFLPAEPGEGYQIDAPLAAAGLAARIAAEPWDGLFLAFDYGKGWDELSCATPHGTARAYRRHVQQTDLLAHPGDQDLTCHVCWDWIAEALAKAGFRCAAVDSQEGFLVRNAGGLLAVLAERGASGFSREKLSLLQLLHPANMGQKFQVLSALRETEAQTPSRIPLPARSAAR